MKQHYLLSDYPEYIRLRHGHHRTIRYQEFGSDSWQSLYGEEFADRCFSVAKALAAEGVEAGDRIGFYAPNSLEGLCAELGTYMMRAVSVPLYATSTPEQVDFIVRDAGIKLLFVGEQFQYNNAFEVQRSNPSLVRLVILDGQVVLHAGDKTSVYYDELLRRGDSKANETAVNISVPQVQPNDIALIIYTSGTSGRSKGVVIRHSNLACQIEAHVKMFTFAGARDVSMSFLPHSHIFEKMWVYFCLYIGSTIAILRDPKKILQALPQINPTMMCNVPRFWEKVYTGVHDKIAHMSPFVQKVMHHAIRVGERYMFDYYNQGKRAPVHTYLLYQLYKHTLFAKVKKTIGLQRGKFFPVAGAALSVEINRFLQSIGIPICLGYGLSESTATVSCFPLRGFDIDSIGEVVEHVEVRIDPETDEILLRGPSIITEYYNNPEANRESFTEDGFFRTGDAGALKGRTLYFKDRLKDLFKTANGKYIAPQMLEGLLASDPIFEQVAIIGDGYKFVSALIYPNWDYLRREANERGVDAEADNETLAQSHEIKRLLMAHIEQALGSVAQYEKVKRFTLLCEPFTIESGELTSTLKIRRKVVSEHYAREIEQMYAEEL